MIPIEIVKCLGESLDRIVDHAENQINLLDYKADPTPPGRWRLSLNGLCRLLYVNFLVILFAGAYLAIEKAFKNALHSYHPLAEILKEFALFGFILSLYLLLRHRLHRDKEDLRSEFASWRAQHEQDRQRLHDFVTGYDDLVDQAIQKGLTRAKSHDLIQNLFGLATPPNSELFLKLERLSGEFHFTRGLTRLSQPTLRVFRELMGSSILDEEWGQLFFTFAIHLQLKPWVTAASHEIYRFTRYYDDVRYLSASEEQAGLCYKQLLREDLEAILNLVNGKLWSVTFRDIDVWRQPAYYASNTNLVERANHAGKDLRRLFLFEDAWLDEEEVFFALAGAALWHLEHGYECRFAQRDKVNSSIVSSDDKNYVASCLLNSTRIIMSQSPVPRANAPSTKAKKSTTLQEDWFRYQCDVVAAVVTSYEDDFLLAWADSDALRPNDFLGLLATRDEHWLANARSWVGSFVSLSKSSEFDG